MDKIRKRYKIETIIDDIKRFNSRKELIDKEPSLMNFIYDNKLKHILNEIHPTPLTEVQILKKEGKKRCVDCKKVMDLSSFPIHTKGVHNTLCPRCESCFKEYNKNYYLSKRETLLKVGGKVEFNNLLSEGKKRCTECKDIKSLTEFYFHKSAKKYVGKCNECMVFHRRKLKPPKEESLLREELHARQLKKCPKCKIIKPYSEYGKNKSNYMGIMPFCKVCKSENDKKYREDPRFKDKLTIKKREYYFKVKDTEKFIDYQKKRLERRDYKKERESMLSSEYRRVKDSLRKITNSAFARRDKVWVKKDTKTEILLGADFFTVKEFIERQFINGMSWDNYGKEWSIDHVIPLDAAGEDIDMIRKLCNFQNLSPMWKKINLQKGYKIPDICTLWENPIVPYKERDIVITPRYDGIVGRYKLIIEPGERYGKLTILFESEPKLLKSGIERRVMTCRCDCGVVKNISLNSLRQGKTISCGCEHKIKTSLYHSTQKKLIFTNDELKELKDIIHTIPKGKSIPKEILNKFEGRTYKQVLYVIRNIRKGTLKRLDHI